jgi:hypothetical protein
MYSQPIAAGFIRGFKITVSIIFQGESVQINKRQPRFHRGAFGGLHGFTELSLPCILSLLRRDLSGDSKCSASISVLLLQSYRYCDRYRYCYRYR